LADVFLELSEFHEVHFKWAIVLKRKVLYEEDACEKMYAELSDFLIFSVSILRKYVS
jgi:hypothetical protein